MNPFSFLFGKKPHSRRRDGPVPPEQGMQEFTNRTGRPLEVYIEMYSDLYVLQPDEVMTVVYDDDPSAPRRGLSTHVFADSLLIYPNVADTASVLINGKPVEPWDQSVGKETRA